MNAFAEKPFLINGVKSWIHCLYFNITAPRKYNPHQYHYHDYIEFLYGVAPSTRVWIGGVSHDLGEGDLIIINSGDYHTISVEKESKYICVRFSPSVLYADEQALLELKYLVPFLPNNPLPKFFTKEQLAETEIGALTEEIMREWENKQTAHELVIRANILKIFASIFRYWSRNDLAVANIQPTDALKKVLAYITENVGTVTEQSAAEACGLSYHYFSSSFRKWTGQSFSEYVKLMRLREAEKMLISTDKSVTDIALAAGFSSASHFISQFKKYKHITPMQFRKKLNIQSAD